MYSMTKTDSLRKRNANPKKLNSTFVQKGKKEKEKEKRSHFIMGGSQDM